MSQSSVDVIRQQNRWVLGSALALSVVLAWSVMAQGLDILYDENQMMEHLQLLVLLVSKPACCRDPFRLPCSICELRQH